jgi:hypothetical protein
LERRKNVQAASRATVQQKSSPEGNPPEKTQEESPEFTNWVGIEPAIQLLRPAIHSLRRETLQRGWSLHPLLQPLLVVDL